MMAHSWLLGYLLCVPVAVISFVLGHSKDNGKVAILERKLSEHAADRTMLQGKYDSLNKSCTAITSAANVQESELSDLKIAYGKLFQECEGYKRELSKFRLKAAGARKTAKQHLN